MNMNILCFRVDTDAAPRGRRRVGRPRKNEKQQVDVEEPIENEEENQGQKKRQIRKVAVKMQKKKVFEKEELDDFEEDSSLQIEVGIGKGAAKTTAVKGKKVGRKKKINPNVELSAKDEGSDKGEGQEKDDNKPVKGQKRKKKEEASKVARKKVKSKKQGAQDGEPSDEETELALPFKVSAQRKMPKLKKQTGVSSPPSQNLMEKLAEVGSDSGSVPDLLPVKSPKRKVGVSGDTGIPSKVCSQKLFVTEALLCHWNLLLSLSLPFSVSLFSSLNTICLFVHHTIISITEDFL